MRCTVRKSKVWGPFSGGHKVINFQFREIKGTYFGSRWKLMQLEKK